MHTDFSDSRWCDIRGAAVVLFLSALASVTLVGCVRYHAKPLAAGKVAGDFQGRSLTDAGLRALR